MRKLAHVLVCAAVLFPVIGCGGESGKGVEKPKDTVPPPAKVNVMGSQAPADAPPIETQ
ncbi:MAG: hypothetical protein JW809_09020 [Pirellulales bacterium]|nr:hypothetical protein [Pirellulales bacterium]